MTPALWRAMREMVRDARAVAGTRKVPPHLREAVKSHAARLAYVRANLA